MEIKDTESILWEIYASNRNVENRNRLFQHYSVWVKKIASNQFAQLRTSTVEWSDCVQNASIALIEAIDRFEFTRGVPFEAFALKRVKGAVINGMPKGKVESIERVLVSEDSAEDNLLCMDSSGNEFEQFIDAVIDIAFSKLLHISSERISYFAEDPLNAYVAQREEEKILHAVTMLSEDLQFVVNSHYNHYLTFTQIADQMGLSKARVSQLHREALKKLRHHYETI